MLLLLGAVPTYSELVLIDILCSKRRRMKRIRILIRYSINKVTAPSSALGIGIPTIIVLA